jgi:putative membrane protein
MANVFLLPKWRPLWLLASFLISALMYLSWAEWEVTRAWWDILDIAVFRSINDSLKENVAWTAFWAIANNRTFDVVGAILFLLLFIMYGRNGAKGDSSTVLQRLSACLLMALAVLAVTQFDRGVLAFDRYSPTLVLDDVLRISEQVSWTITKDYSHNSFPGDHGTVSLCFMFFLMIFGGRRYASHAAIVCIICILPRMVSGAHWVSDILIGSMMLTLPTIGFIIGTPYFSKAAVLLAGVFQRTIPQLEQWFLEMTNKQRFYITLKGMCIGAADIIPGVSGSTMAFILGVYKQLLHAITRFNRNWLEKLFRLEWGNALADIPVFFLLPLVTGIVLAIILFTRLIPMGYLLEVHPEPVYGLFFGLIVGSIILLCHQHLRIKLSHLLYLLLGSCFGYLAVSLIPADTPDEPWFIFVCGMIAICAMLLPGLSGSFILLVLGKYALILDALGEFDLTLLLPFATGCLFGLLFFSHVFYWLLRRFQEISTLFIIGIMMGCLHAIWPFQERIYADIRGKAKLVENIPLWPTEDMPLLLTIMMMFCGLVIVAVLHLLSSRRTVQIRS